MLIRKLEKVQSLIYSSLSLKLEAKKGGDDEDDGVDPTDKAEELLLDGVNKAMKHNFISRIIPNISSCICIYVKLLFYGLQSIIVKFEIGTLTINNY